jgi:VanZ family protein
VAWLLFAVIAFLSLSPPSYRPVTPLGHGLEHFSIHVLVGLSFGIGYAKRWRTLALGLVTLAGIVEFAQLFVPGRHARMRDFLVDAGSACLGLALAWIITSIRSTPSQTNP